METLGLTGQEKGNQQVQCPFHDDTNASASVNLEKGVLHCFTCGEGWSLDGVEDRLGGGGVDVDSVATPAPTPEPAALPDDWVDPTVEGYLGERGFTTDDLTLDFRIEDGYLQFGETGVSRNLRPDERPRYKNERGQKSLVWVQPPANGEPVWIVEGIFDALTLWLLLPGHGAVAASLGAEVSQGQAYELRGRTVFILYDADHVGYTHSRKVAEKLKEFDVNPIIVDFPGGKRGKDLNEAFVKSRAWLKAWVEEQVSRYDRSDTTYVTRLFSGEQDHLTVLPSGINGWDEYLGGGFRPGVHMIGAEPGIGKTSLVTDLAVRWAEGGKRVLFVTQEISKRQQWARISSKKSKRSWRYLETEPEALEPEANEWVKSVAKNIRVVSGWNMNQIAFVAPHYDVIIVDYLQRMPGPYKGDNVKANVDYNIESLSDLGRDLGKVVICVSSFKREAYRRDSIGIDDFKESGNIEFVAVSLVGFRRPDDGARIHGSIVKNTRGKKGMFFMEADLQHQTFRDAKPLSTTQKSTQEFKKLRSNK
jgi:hypothetical protein